MTLSGLLAAVIDLYVLVLIVRAVFSWLPPQTRANQIYAFLLAITEPVLGPVRRRLPPMSGLDLSPLVVLVVLFVLRRLLVG